MAYHIVKVFAFYRSPLNGQSPYKWVFWHITCIKRRRAYDKSGLPHIVHIYVYNGKSSIVAYASAVVDKITLDSEKHLYTEL